MKAVYHGKAADRLNELLQGVKGAGSNKLGERLCSILETCNARDREAGVDRYGKTLAPLRRPRKGEYAGMTGPPLMPRSSSRSVRLFSARYVKTGNGLAIRAGWVGEGSEVISFHGNGTVKGAPRRDIRGASPKTWTAIRAAIAAWKADLLRRQG